ncbi:hypothetical protein [Psychrobacillus sp. L3]|uniref:hypothetical protein n=1 Tax=Psychrobacillus sp. L3 TaxID=3236891 RepID=UPI0036F3C48A
MKGVLQINYFWKLNIVSAIYAFFLFFSFELQLNFYRIWRLSGWEANSVSLITALLHIVGFLLLTLLVYMFDKKWMQDKKSKYWSSILWLPYLIIFLFIFATLFPITYRGDDPAPASGLIIFGQLIIYPFYLSFIYFIRYAIEGVTVEKVA